jgi:hypothetical protein
VPLLIFATAASVTSGVVACSDIRWKKNITPLPNALANVLKLQPVNYYWKKDEFPNKQFTDTKQIGLIAQELEKIYPELVISDKEGFKSVDYSRLTPILVGAIKDQQKLIQDIQNQNEVLQKSIENLNINNKNYEIKFKTSEIKMQKLEAALDVLLKANIKEEAKK